MPASITAHTPRLLTEQSGRVLTVRFNNPPHHFYDEPMSVELDDLTRQVQRDRSIGAVVFTGQGSAFTHLNAPDLLRGARLTPFGITYRPARAVAAASSMMCSVKTLDRVLRRSRARDLMMLPRTTSALNRMGRMDTVFISAINGNALAFGCVLALACDIRLMADGDHVIGLPEATCAMLAGSGGTQRLVRAVGASRAAALLLEGTMLSPAEAAAIGLIHRVVPGDTLQDEAHTTAHRLADRSPLVTRTIKRAVYHAGSKSLAAGLRSESAAMIAVVTARGTAESVETLRDQLNHTDLTDTGPLIRRSWERFAEPV